MLPISAQAAFIRYAFGLVLTAPVLWRLVAHRQWPTRPGLCLVRGACHAIGVMLWFYAMARIPVAEVTAIGFTTPLFVTIGAALFLVERLRARRIGAVLIGFCGTLMILQPGLKAIEAGALAQVAAAPVLACSYLIAKKLTETESPVAIVAYLSVFVTAALAPLALLSWRTPTVEELVREQLGWHVPAVSLAWWVRGVQAPGTVGKRVPGPDGTLSELEQDGWRIEYGRYRDVGGILLPLKMTARQQDRAVKLAVREWTIGNDDG